MKKTTLLFSGTLLLSMLAACAGGSGITYPDPDRSPEEVLAEYTASSSRDVLPGLGVSVLRGGETVYRQVAGVRAGDSNEPIGEADPFHLGSNTKAMTALLCGILIDRGLLSWNTTVGEVLGTGFPMMEEYRVVTLEQLLSHSSGIPGGLPRDPWMSFFPYDSPAGGDRERMVAESLSLKPAHPAGSAFLYSNLGYTVAGYMLEKVSGKTWETLMREELFEPLQMLSAGFGPPGRGTGAAETPSAPRGHSPGPVNPDFMYADNPAALGPAGTVHANLEDLEKYLTVYLNGGLDRHGRRIVSEATLETLIRPRLGDYALGWLTGISDQGKGFISHDGSNTMFYCSFAVFPESGDAVIVLTNRGDGKSELRVMELLLYFAERFFDATITGEE